MAAVLSRAAPAQDAARGAPLPTRDPSEETTIAELQRRMTDGETARVLTEAYLERHARAGPKFRPAADLSRPSSSADDGRGSEVADRVDLRALMFWLPIHA